MKPALFLSPHISSYSIFLLLGFLFGWLLARSRADLFRIRRADLDNLALIFPIAGLFGARFFARLFYAKVSFLEALKVWEGDGLVFYGGFLLSVGAVVAYAALRKVSLLALCDCLAPSVAVGLAFGRVGCFMAGCCWGDICADPPSLQPVSSPAVLAQIHSVPAISSSGWPLAVRFPRGSEAYRQHLKYHLISSADSASLPVHPVQLYEAFAAALFALFLHARFQSNHRARSGNASLALIAGYALIRFGTEFLRADNKTYFGSLTFSQTVSIELLLAVGALVILRSIYSSRTVRSTPLPADPPEPVSASPVPSNAPRPQSSESLPGLA